MRVVLVIAVVVIAAQWVLLAGSHLRARRMEEVLSGLGLGPDGAPLREEGE